MFAGVGVKSETVIVTATGTEIGTGTVNVMQTVTVAVETVNGAAGAGSAREVAVGVGTAGGGQGQETGWTIDSEEALPLAAEEEDSGEAGPGVLLDLYSSKGCSISIFKNSELIIIWSDDTPSTSIFLLHIFVV